MTGTEVRHRLVLRKFTRDDREWVNGRGGNVATRQDNLQTDLRCAVAYCLQETNTSCPNRCIEYG